MAVFVNGMSLGHHRPLLAISRARNGLHAIIWRMVKSSIKTAVVKTKYGSFKAIFEPEIDMGGYVVTAPKVQGTVSWGKNLSHAKEMIVECIEGAIEARIIVEAVKQGNLRFTARASKMPALA